MGKNLGKVRDNTTSFFMDLTRIQPGMDPRLHFRCICYPTATEAAEDVTDSALENYISPHVRHEANNTHFRQKSKQLKYDNFFW
jgi:hypothetical protein